MPDAVIAIDGLTKSYLTPAGEVPVLKGLDVTIAPGEFVAVMGPSGSGKSTFMNILGCLDVPSGGRYVLNGQDIRTLDNDALAALRNQVTSAGGTTAAGLYELEKAGVRTALADALWAAYRRSEELGK